MIVMVRIDNDCDVYYRLYVLISNDHFHGNSKLEHKCVITHIQNKDLDELAARYKELPTVC